MYRSRLGEGLDKITLEYVSSVSEDANIAPYDILGSQAHVIMLFENQLLSKNDAKKILKTLEELKKFEFTKNNGSEDIHELIEGLVIKKIGMAAGGKMHTARSRNDQVSLDIRMKIRDDIITLTNCLLDVIEALLSVANIHHKTIMPLYTHLQQAQVGTFSHYLLSHADVLFRDVDRLYCAFKRVNQSPLGAGPVGGTSLPIDRRRTAKLLGFDDLIENSIDAISSRDFVMEYLSTLAILMTNISKLSEDFVIWSSSEFSFIELSDEFSSPSSVMPQKKNPDILELARAKTAEVIGNLTSSLVIIKGLPTGYDRDLQQIKSLIWRSSQISISTLIIIRSMLLTLSVNKKNMKKAAEHGYLIALDIAEKLVEKGMPFREAHKLVGQLVQTANKQKKNLSKLSDDEIKQIAKITNADSASVIELVRSATIVSSLRDRKSEGSAGFSEQQRMLKDRTEKIQTYRSDAEKLHETITTSLSELSSIIRKLTK